MPKAAVFTMKLEPDLRAEFMAAAEASHRPASQVVRQSMRGFVQREQDRCDHGAFLQRKVEAARVSVHEGQGRPDAALRMDRLFSDAAATLVDFPTLGHEGEVPGTRELTPHRSYRLVYEVVGDRVGFSC